MSMPLIGCLAATEELAAAFSDQRLIEAMLEFEVALARAEAGVGVIPAAAAEAIDGAARAGDFDIAALAARAQRAGTPGLPLAAMLAERVRLRAPEQEAYVHWGATSQDTADTAMVLVLRRCRDILSVGQQRLERALARLSDDHAATVMLGRTLLQPAPPVTFGLKAAGWRASIGRSWARLSSAFEEGRVLQFGGASGTLAALGDRGIEVSEALAIGLGLKCPEAPWHAHRDRVAALAAALGVYTGALGKMALDICLLAQAEVAEVSEPGGAGRGGSSTMPHKRNPIASTLASAAARRAPGLVADLLACMPQEHERAAGGWQAEWSTLAALVQSTGLALASMAEAAEGLQVHPGNMRRNLDATRGAVFAERASLLLAPVLGREAARALLEQVCAGLDSEGGTLAEALASTTEVAMPADLESPEAYLGSAEIFRRRLLSPQED